MLCAAASNTPTRPKQSFSEEMTLEQLGGVRHGSDAETTD